jgi:hypothetical protein
MLTSLCHHDMQTMVGAAAPPPDHHPVRDFSKVLDYHSVLKAASRTITKVRDLEPVTFRKRDNYGTASCNSSSWSKKTLANRSVCPNDIQMICNNRMVRDYVSHV